MAKVEGWDGGVLMVAILVLGENGETQDRNSGSGKLVGMWGNPGGTTGLTKEQQW